MTTDTESIELFRESLCQFMATADRNRLRGHLTSPRPVDTALGEQVAELGWSSLLLPEALDGLELTLADMAQLCEEAGKQLFAEPVAATIAMPSLLLKFVNESANTPLMTNLAQAVLSGTGVVSVAWQSRSGQLFPEPEVGQLRQGALFGEYHFVPSAHSDSTVIVLAQRQGEALLIAVPGSADNVSMAHKAAGLNHHSTIGFSGTAVGDEMILARGSLALDALEKAIDGTRIVAAAEAAGLAMGCLDKTLEYLRERTQFGHALGSFQVLQHKCADLYIETELAKASWRDAAEKYSASGDYLPSLYAAKARCGETAVRVARECVQYHGGMGFCEEVDIGLFLRHALYLNAWLGSPKPMRRLFSQRAMPSTPAYAGEDRK